MLGRSLEQVLSSYHNTLQDVSGVSPSRISFRREIRIPGLPAISREFDLKEVVNDTLIRKKKKKEEKNKIQQGEAC